MILFRDGDDVRYFVVRGVMESDRRVIRCDMVKVMDWDRLIEYLGMSGRSYGTRRYSN
jgi:hypothetical protein